MKKLTNREKLYIAILTSLLIENAKENEEKENELYKLEKENRDNILGDIAKVLLSYKIVDSVMDISNTEKDKLYMDFSNKIDKAFSKEAKEEYKITLKILVQSGKDRHNINNSVNSLGIKGFVSKKIEDKAIKKIINTRVDSKLWSDRLWDNKEEIAKILKSDIKDFLDGKINVNEIEQHIKDRFNSNAYNTKRLVQDNVARCQNGVNEKWRKDNDIEYVLYTATLEKTTCDKCSKYDGETFEVGKEPIKLPQHPFCRCVYLPIPSKKWQPKERLDNITKQNIAYKKYKEWIKDN